MIGQAVGSYRITGQLGVGGMGAVYTAEHTLIGRVTAIKMLLPELSKNQEIVNRFFNEAKAATAIRHPGIVEIYDFGYHTDGSAYIVMEHLDGESLETRLRRFRRLAAEEAISIARQVASGLAAAHAAGIVHRDLKPDNLFIVPDPDIPGGERTKILDFGIAKLINADEAGPDKTRTGMIMGTPSYMSPEQCRGGGRLDHRADIYSLGCILFEMLCGRPPFLGEGAGDVIAQHIYQPPPQPRTLYPTMSADFEQLILQLLAKAPEDRMQSADELLSALDALAATMQIVPYAASAASVSTVQAPIAGSGAVPAIGTASGAVQGTAPGTGPGVAPGTGPGIGSTPPGTLRYPEAAPEGPRQTTFSAAAGSSTATPVPVSARGKTGMIVLSLLALGIAIGGTVFALSAGSDSASEASRDADLRASQPSADRAVPETRPSDVPGPVPDEAPPPMPEDPPAAPSPITIAIDTNPTGAFIYQMPSGRRLGSTPFKKTLKPAEGELEFVVRRKGFSEATVVVSASESCDRVVPLEKKHRSTRKSSKASKPAPTPDNKAPVKGVSGRLDPFDKN